MHTVVQVGLQISGLVLLRPQLSTSCRRGLQGNRLTTLLPTHGTMGYQMLLAACLAGLACGGAVVGFATATASAAAAATTTDTAGWVGAEYTPSAAPGNSLWWNWCANNYNTPHLSRT